MNITFKSTLNPAWTLMDDRIIIRRKTIMLLSIEKVEHTTYKGRTNPNIQVGTIFVWQDGKVTGLHYPVKQKVEGAEAADYIMSYINSDYRKKVEERNEERNKEVEKFGVDDYYMQCDLCKHIFHYTRQDLMDDAEAENDAVKQQIWGSIQMIAGNAYLGKSDINRGEDKVSKVPDRSKCPKCGNSKLIRLTEKEARAEIEKQNAPTQVVSETSAADEIKKFKELLDMGVITQEEFDAKKKQLLGL